jgi:hypothetical protein
VEKTERNGIVVIRDWERKGAGETKNVNKLYQNIMKESLLHLLQHSKL